MWPTVLSLYCQIPNKIDMCIEGIEGSPYQLHYDGAYVNNFNEKNYK